MDMVPLTSEGALVSTLIGVLSELQVSQHLLRPSLLPRKDRISHWNVTALQEHHLAPHLVEPVCSSFSRLELLVC